VAEGDEKIERRWGACGWEKREEKTVIEKEEAIEQSTQGGERKKVD